MRDETVRRLVALGAQITVASAPRSHLPESDRAAEATRMAQFGDPRLPPRFWEKVRILDNGCWQWTGSRNEHGYGKVWDGAHAVRAHRWAREVLVGPTPDQMLDHRCHGADLTCLGGPSCPHRACVNPAHLEPTSNRQNILAGRTIPAGRAAQTHCLRGHEFTADNIYVPPGRPGARSCRACRPQVSRVLRSTCSAGHEYTEDNTYYHRTNRYRTCRTCVLAYNRAYRARRRSA